MRTLALYSPAIVLVLWAVVSTLRMRGHAIDIAGLVATSGAVVAHTREEIRRIRDDW